MQQGTGVDLNPPKTPLRNWKWSRHQWCWAVNSRGCAAVNSRAGIAASSQKMQRELESNVLEKAQIGPVFIKPEMSPLWRQSLQPWGTRNVCGFSWGGTVLSCPWLQDWGDL